MDNNDNDVSEYTILKRQNIQVMFGGSFRKIFQLYLAKYFLDLPIRLLCESDNLQKLLKYLTGYFPPELSRPCCLEDEAMHLVGDSV